MKHCWLARLNCMRHVYLPYYQRISDLKAEFETVCRHWLEMRDFVWIELILIEFSGHFSLLRKDKLQYDYTKLICSDLAKLSQWLTMAISYLKSEALQAGVTSEKIRSIFHNCHLVYNHNKSHPWSLLHDYLDPVKLHVYLELYPGLNEMIIGDTLLLFRSILV